MSTSVDVADLSMVRDAFPSAASPAATSSSSAMAERSSASNSDGASARGEWDMPTACHPRPSLPPLFLRLVALPLEAHDLVLDGCGDALAFDLERHAGGEAIAV